MAAIDPEGLQKVIEKTGWTGHQRRLAEQVGISPQYLTDIIQGRRTLKRNPELRERLARALDVPRRWIERACEEAA